MSIDEIYPSNDPVEQIAKSLENDFINLCKKNGLKIIRKVEEEIAGLYIAKIIVP